MDELTIYLKTGRYNKISLEQILNKKIIITKNHINNIYFTRSCGFNIINLFEKYGYIFMDDDYILLVSKNGMLLRYIPEDKITDKICKIAIQQNVYALRYVPIDKITDKICKMAVQQNGTIIEYILYNKITDEICKISVQQTGYALEYIPDDKQTDEICRISVEQNKGALNYVPRDKKHLFIKNENNNI